jgi:hypothetical protein
LSMPLSTSPRMASAIFPSPTASMSSRDNDASGVAAGAVLGGEDSGAAKARWDRRAALAPSDSEARILNWGMIFPSWRAAECQCRRPFRVPLQHTATFAPRTGRAAPANASASFRDNFDGSQQTRTRSSRDSTDIAVPEG